MAKRTPWVPTADNHYSSLKTEPTIFRMTAVPPKFCVIQEVRREKG